MTDRQSTETLAGLKRELFEKWAKEEIAINPRRYYVGSREYTAPLVQSCWLAWQAASEIREEALERAARKIANGKVIRLNDFMSERLNWACEEVLEILRDEIGGK